MKSIIIISLFILTTFFCSSCKKDTIVIKGNWKWVYSTSGGIIYNKIEPSDGTTVSLSLNSDLTYTIYLNNQTNTQGLYHITPSSDVNTINFDKAINIDKLFLEEEEGIYESNDSLFLLNKNIEAVPTAVFVKMK
jgi:hypothetical protein